MKNIIELNGVNYVSEELVLSGLTEMLREFTCTIENGTQECTFRINNNDVTARYFIKKLHEIDAIISQ